jgi:orotate phosphoribosyltransferase
MKAVELAEAEGLRVIQTITVVDRQEGASEMMSAKGYTLEALVTREELEG